MNFSFHGKKNKKMLKYLYKDQNSSDISINNIPFHKVVLRYLPYFSALNNFKERIDETILLPYCNEAISVFKLWLYERPIKLQNLTPKIIIDIFNLSDFFTINLWYCVRAQVDIAIRKFNNENMIKVFSNVSGLELPSKLKETDRFLEENLNTYELNIKGVFLHRKGLYEDAFTIFKKNWEVNFNYDSLHNLAYYYGNLKKDNQTEFNLLYQAYNLHQDPNTVNNLAYCYAYGNVKRDEKLAYEMVKKNWKLNKDKNSLKQLSIFYYEGKYVKKDEKKAFRLTKKNWEENGCLVSLQMLINFYNNGICTKKSEDVANMLKSVLNEII